MNLWYVCGDRGIDPAGTKGASIHVDAITRALARRGVRVTGLTRRWSGEGSSAVPWVTFDRDFDPRRVAERAGDPDVVLERYSLSAGAGLRAAWEYGVPYVLEVNAPLVLEARRYRPETVFPAHESRESALFRGADLVLTVSEPLREFAGRVRGKDDGVVVIRNGADRSLAELARVEEEIPVILFLGHPKPWHGFDRLIPLLEFVRGEGISARLVVVGGGAGADEIRREAGEKNLEGSVTVEHGEDRVLHWLRRADVSVAPYPDHDFFYFCPLKIVDSMMAGVAVVTTDQGDLREIVGEAGRVVSASEPSEVFRGVAELLRDRPRARKLGDLGRARAIRDMTWDSVAARMLEYPEFRGTREIVR